LVDVLTIVAGTILAVLVAATSYAAVQYYKQLRKAQKEYEKARDMVEDIVLSFNRELKREAEKIEDVTYRTEGVAAQAEVGLRKADNLDERVTPIEFKVDKLSTEVGTLTSLIGSLTQSNAKMLEEISSMDTSEIGTKIHGLEEASTQKLSSIDSKVHGIEASQEGLKTKIAGLEEQVQKLSVSPEANADTSLSIPVMPIKRDKAMASLTETEVAVLEFLASEGPKTAPEIKEKVNLSREHTARLMKKLYEEGYLERETGKLPFRYSVKKEMEKLLRKPEPPTTT
jgi:outer membrane murein-binding lipoprotein Lpp